MVGPGSGERREHDRVAGDVVVGRPESLAGQEPPSGIDIDRLVDEVEGPAEPEGGSEAGRGAQHDQGDRPAPVAGHR